MNFLEAREYMNSLIGLGSKPGLNTIQELMNRLGNPQDDCRYVHIAGTNGKGSTHCFIASILKKAGYRVGRYTSPVVFKWSEQFVSGSQPITKKEYAQLTEEIKQACDSMVEDGLCQPTLFEVETALAFLFFRLKKCDIAVLECGMGGLLDATNVVKNTLVSVFTPIDMDHTAFLGETLEEIATTKSGIIKENCQVVSAPQRQQVEAVIAKASGQAGNGNPVFCRMEDITAKKATAKAFERGENTFSYKAYRDLKLSLMGSYQHVNAALAIEAAEALVRQGYKITEKHIRAGLLEAKWPGRWQKLMDRPMLIIDGAHNPQAFREIDRILEAGFTNRKIVLIIGMLKDKEYEEAAGLIAPRAAQIFTVTPNSTPRALDAITLAKALVSYNNNVTAMDSVEEALEAGLMVARAWEQNGDKALVLVTGSLSYLAKVVEYIK